MHKEILFWQNTRKNQHVGGEGKGGRGWEVGGHKQMTKPRTVPNKVSKAPIFGETRVGHRRLFSFNAVQCCLNLLSVCTLSWWQKLENLKAHKIIILYNVSVCEYSPEVTTVGAPQQWEPPPPTYGHVGTLPVHSLAARREGPAWRKNCDRDSFQ